MPRGPGKMQQKIILLLFGGLALGLTHSPRKYFEVLDSIAKEWRNIDKGHLKRAIADLYRSKLVEEKENKDGTFTIVLSAAGKKRALTYELDKMKIGAPTRWDGKWRMVMSDIPENRKREREALRSHLREMDFYEFQKSVFAHPYDCRDEMDYLIEFYGLRRFVRFVVAESLDNELHLKKHFGLV